MPVKIDGRIYYRTAEVCQIVGIGKSTLFRWIRQNVVQDAECRDRKGWRLFAEDELRNLEAETKRVQKNHLTEMREMPSLLRNRF
jgi:predicted site-specific integrase-resolvase